MRPITVVIDQSKTDKAAASSASEIEVQIISKQTESIKGLGAQFARPFHISTDP
jgi:hypothetical protein